MLRKLLIPLLALPLFGLSTESRAADNALVALTLAGGGKPFAMFRCSETQVCRGDTLLEQGGLRLPLTITMEATSGDVRFSSIECPATGWHFSLLQDHGQATFPLGQTTGTLWLNTLGLSVDPTARNPAGIAVARVVVSLWRKEGGN